MILLNLDTEQAAMIVIAAEASNAILRARLHRADPDSVISNSSILQEHKIEALRLAMDQGKLAGWLDLDASARAQFIALVGTFQVAAASEERQALYEAMTAFIVGHRVQQKQLPGAQNDRVR